MTVYADILILVNFVVDYFLILLTQKLLHKKVRLWKLLLGAAAGGFFSLYIFLPQVNFALEIMAHILMCGLMCLVTFGFYGIKDFFRCAASLFAVNFAYSGAMIAVWYFFKPEGMVINNSIIYFDISPLFLIAFSVLGYFVVSVLKGCLEKTFPQNTKCEVTVCCGSKSLNLSGIADTGNSLSDAFGISQIFITETDVVEALLCGEDRQTRYRAIPCATVTGSEILDGYRIENAEIVYNKRKYTFKNPVLAVSRVPLKDSKVIINPEIFN